MSLKKAFLCFTILSVIVSCVKEPAGNGYSDSNVKGTVELLAKIGESTKASVTEQGVVSLLTFD